jgi:hypothetical protein
MKTKVIQNNVEIMKRETPYRNCKKIPNEYPNKMSILAKCCKMFWDLRIEPFFNLGFAGKFLKYN